MFPQISFASELFLGILSGIATIPIIAFGNLIIRRYRNRYTRRFWKPFINHQISILMTEYEWEGNDTEAKTAQSAAGGYLVSRGNALAMSNLVDFLPDQITKRSNVSVSGDKSSANHDCNLIIIGSPANNKVSEMIFSALEERFEIPYEILHNTSTGVVSIKSKIDGTEYIPSTLQSGNEIDYALIIRAKYRSFPDRFVVMLAGAHMYGAYAASKAVTNREIINLVARVTKRNENVAFLVKTNVVNNNPSDPELEFGNSRFIHVLEPKS